MPLELGTLLYNRYRIVEELGRGGMGAVFRGHDESLGVEVAIKENHFVSPEAERQFFREATLLASLRHLNLPRVTDHFVIPGEGQYLVMDYVPGDDARQLLERRGGPVLEADVLRWMGEILDAVNYLHTRPQSIIHRDIKPGNIKITPEGQAVLVDFGLAKVHDALKSTTIGAKAFTPGFSPPEQYGRGRTDVRTDIYSLGATIYNLLTNIIPADSLGRAMGQQRLVPILELNPSISLNVADAVERAIAIKPGDRFATVQELLEALAPEPEIATGDAATPLVDYAPTTERAKTSVQPEPTLLKPAAPTERKRNFRFITIIIGVVFVVAFGAWGLLTIAGVLDGPEPTITPVPPTYPVEDGIALAPSEAATEVPLVVLTNTPPPDYTQTPEISPTADATPRGGGQGQIAFVSERAGLPQIFLINVEGSNVIQLTTMPDGACQPAWSPNGEHLLFVSPCRKKADHYPNAAIYIMNSDGNNVQSLITLLGGVFDADWSDAGIIFTYLENNKPGIWITDQQGRGAQQISRSNAYDRQPNWSPGGDKLVLMNTSRTGSPTIYWVFDDGSFSGSNPKQVTRDQQASSPDWSPTGNLIAYVVDDTHIWVVKWDAVGYGAIKLTTKGPNADPNWSPDGQWITYESWRDAANHDIYIMTANGGIQTRLTDNAAWDYQPAWRP